MSNDSTLDAAGALLARKTWRTLEPLHGMIYFVPEAHLRVPLTGILRILSQHNNEAS